MEELDLKELLITMWEKKIIIVAVTAVFLLIGVVYSFFFVTPKYESYTQLLLIKNSSTSQNEEGERAQEQGITQTDLNLNKSLVSEYSTLLKTKMVLSEVLNNLKENSEISIPKTLSEENIKNNISVTSVKDTNIINITVRNEDPELAKAIAAELSDAFTKKVNELYHINNVNVVEEPEANYNPVNINHAKDIIIFVLIGIVVSCMYVFIMELFNVRIKTVSDIEKITNIPVIAEISMITNKKGEM